MTNLKELKAYRRRDKIAYLMDIIATIPFELWIYFAKFTPKTEFMLFKIFRSNRLLRAKFIGMFHKMQLDKININIILLDMNFSYALIILLLHLMACFIVGFSSFTEINMSVNIGDLYNMTSVEKMRLYVRYAFAMFHVSARMANDVYFPLTVPLIIVFIVIMCLIPITTTLVLVQASIITVKVHDLKTQFREKTETLFFFAEREELSESIKHRLSHYINMLWLHHEGIIMPKLLLMAPTNTVQSLFNGLFLHHIENHMVFQNCEEDFKRQLICYIKIDLYFPGDYITHKNIINNTMYFIEKGTVFVYDEDATSKEIYINQLTTMNYFGVTRGFDELIPHKYGYKARDDCVVFRLNYNHWKHLLDFFPKSKRLIQRTVKNYKTRRLSVFIK